MHILVKSQDEFQKVSNEVRKLLHRFGVHSSTIQPELLEEAGKAGSVTVSRQGSHERLIVSNGSDIEVSRSSGCVDAY